MLRSKRDDITRRGFFMSFPDYYQLSSEFGEGAVAKVVRAGNRKTGNTVALKVLKDITDEEDIRRLGREMEILSRIEHPAVVRYLGHGTTSEGAPYVEMEWLEGSSLRDVLMARERLELIEILDILIPVISALATCHENGIIHRDIKPENIMLCSPGGKTVKLIDFGMAKLLKGTPITHDGQLFGTPQYIAPERITMDQDLTGAIDVYALGIMAYEMMTGVRPFDHGEVQKILMMHLTEKVPPMHEMAPDLAIHPGFSRIVRRMVRQEPLQRPLATTLYTDFRVLRATVERMDSRL